tara:strand:- start:1937 stop:3451 length:1515 start_codon:yes stop_codon:yes gene_type:complete
MSDKSNSKFSTSMLDGAKHLIPDSDDLELEEFIKKNIDRKVVAVQGLGFVGTVMSLVIANDDNDQYAVLGVDQKTTDSYWKIGDLRDGKLPIISSDPLVKELHEKSIEKMNFLATFDSKAYKYADYIIVDINLDVQKVSSNQGKILDYEVSLTAFEQAIQEIGKFCKPEVLVLVETTVPPGTCRKIAYPILKNELKKRNLPEDKFKLGHSYERVMPGPNYIDSIKNFYRVYSGINERSATEVEKFLKTIISTDKFPLTRLHSTEASEMAKVLENSYRAMNISFMVEWSRFAENSGVNIYEVIDAIRQRPTHANMMYPGIGVGGYCLTKDPLLASWASKKFFNLNTGLESSVKAVEINDQMPIFCFNFIEGVLKSIDKKIKNVGFLGVAYGPGIGDTRFSPVEKLYKLMSKEFNIFCSDPYVKYWQEMDISPYQNINDLLVHKLDCIIITTGHKDYIESDHIYKFLAQSEVNSIPIIDTVGLIDSSKLPNCYESGKNFFVLGTGN